MAANELLLKNQDAVEFLPTIPAHSIQCIVCDPPFGLGEDTFGKHYARDSANVIEGYVAAPKDAAGYQAWAAKWIR